MPNKDESFKGRFQGALVEIAKVKVNTGSE